MTANSASRFFQSLEAIARASSPAWHRHQRARRAEARARLKRVQSDLHLLRGHHSRPAYTSLRMSGWGSPQWSGSYWGASGRANARRRAPKNRGKGNDHGKGSDKGDKGKKQEQGKFPAYDAMPVEQSTSSASSSGGSAELMQKAMKSLIQNNPTLQVPKEVEMALGFQGGLTKTAKDALYDQQRLLNLRRKANNKVEKLQHALTRKELQMTAYKEEMRQKLAAELERFNKERQQLSEDLEKAKAYLAKVENGEEPEEIAEETNMEVADDSLANLLGLQNEDAEEIARLKQEKVYAETMAAQLQHQVQMMMSAAAAGGANPLAAPMFGAGSRVDSPQLPGVGAAQNQYGMSRVKSTDRSVPYGRESKEPKDNDDKKERDGVEVIPDSPDLVKMS